MSALQIVQGARRTLAVTVVLAALLWGGTAGIGVMVIVGLLSLIVPLPPGVHAALWPMAGSAAVAVAGTVLWRLRRVRSVERVALWIEERQPELRFTLVTAINPEVAPVDRYPELHARAEAADIGELVRRAWRRTLGRALIVFLPLVAIATLLDTQELISEARVELARRASAEGETAALASRLESLTARITPPAYTRLPATTLEEPSDIAALIGSRIAFTGDGPEDGITAAFAGDTLVAGPAAGSGSRGWEFGLVMPDSPDVVAFQDREYSRHVVLEPQADSVPTVRLRLPVSDTTYQTVPSGQMVVEAELEDDFGLDYGYVEYLLTTGGGELFDTELSEGPRQHFENVREATLRDAVDLDTMGLAPGTVMHIRVIAFDYNDVTGPGRGVSETRTLRIAEPEDSVSVNPAPPLPIDSMWISQRLLNMKTDTLIQDQDELDRRTFMGTSSGYSNTQEEIRTRAQAVISILEDDGVGGTFETQVSRMLREAIELMYEARVHLAIAQPDSAMPYMIDVLDILDEIRLANRYYLRGIVLPQAVNIERVRLTGEDPAGRELREARSRLEDPLATLAARIDHAAALIETEPDAALDSLAYIRVAALTDAPLVATSLAEAVQLLQRGVEADSALARTRRALERKPTVIDGPIEWGGIP